jgi:sulfate permease
MILLIGLAMAAAFGLALNIGANNAGVNMAPAYGAGARSKWASLVLFAVFAIAGAVLLGGRVVKTIGKDLFTEDLSTHAWLFLVVAPAISIGLLALANYFKLPVPTTPLAVSALIGIGLTFDGVNGRKVREVLVWWLATPVASLILTWLAGKLIVRLFPRLLHPEALSPRARRIIGLLLTFEGCYSAFAIGANNVANSMAPIVGAGHLSLFWGTVVGGLGMAVGALLWGGRVLETVGKGITELCHTRALVVGVIAATGMVLASWFGAPVSGACIVTMGVVGFSVATAGLGGTADNKHVRRIVLLWAAGPAVAIGFTWGTGLLLR